LEPPTEGPTGEPPTSEGPTAQPPTSEPPATTAPPSPSPTATAPDVTAWAPFTDYIAGQLVSFAGKEYQVQQTHTSLPGWEPPKLPELFKLI
jgi:chitin-binding protein